MLSGVAVLSALVCTVLAQKEKCVVVSYCLLFEDTM